MERIGGHAVVLGGSMAGLVAARALTDAFERVTVVERDRLPAPGEHRTGVPQGRHAHALLASGALALEELLPGLREELIAAGGPISDGGRDGQWYSGGGLLAKAPFGTDGALVTRPVLEGCVRERVRGLPRVTFREGTAVRGLTTGDGGTGVTGVIVSARDGGFEDELAADLVVDATGRGSRAGKWLTELGYEEPPEDQVHVGIRYVTRYFRRSPSDLGGALFLNIAQHPPNRRMGVAMAVEGDRWLVTLASILGEPPPTEIDAFVEWAAGLPSPGVHELIRGLEPVGEAASTGFPAHRRRRYERLRRLPERFVVMGDAVCSFNPVYGQGMSVAAKEAILLRDCLAAGGLEGLPRRFFSRVAKVVDAPWEIAVGGDLRFPEVEAERPLRVRLVNRYVERLLAAAHGDPVVAGAFFDVANLRAAPPSLLRPSIALRVIRSGRRRNAAPTVGGTPAGAHVAG